MIPRILKSHSKHSARSYDLVLYLRYNIVKNYSEQNFPFLANIINKHGYLKNCTIDTIVTLNWFIYFSQNFC